MRLYATLTRPPGLNYRQWLDVAEKAKAALEDVTPVRTGHLQASWSILGVNAAGIHVRNGADYASFVNNGTPLMASRDMTGKAQAILDDLAQELT